MPENNLLDDKPDLLSDETTVRQGPARVDSGPEQLVSVRFDLQYPPRMPSLIKHPLKAAAWFTEAFFGLVSLTVLLAVAATLPVIHVLVLGYLMEVQGRVARGGKFRSAFYLLPLARRLGIIVLAVALWLLPIQLLAGFTRDNWLLAPASLTAWLTILSLITASVLVAGHLMLAIGFGGRWWQFLLPLRNLRRLLSERSGKELTDGTHRRICVCLAELRFAHLLRLGVLGYTSAYLWLVVPAMLFTSLTDLTSRLQLLAFAVGCAALTLTLMWLPLLMAHVAAQGRLKAMLEFPAVYRLACRTPLCWALSTSVLLACSTVPMLYSALIKNQLPPHEVRWDLMFVFLVTVVPARVLVGWVYHRATMRPATLRRLPAKVWQWSVTAVLLIGVGYYVYFLNLAETGGELGQDVIWQFPSVLQPWPW